MELYDFPRSSAAYRVRIACALKGLSYKKTLIDFRAGAQRSPEYLALAPSGLTPTLVTDDGLTLSQSLAIITYLDATAPAPRLIPADPIAAAKVWEMALIVACDVHPLNNLRVLKYLEGPLGVGEEAKNTWCRHWVTLGFEAFEARARASAGTYCFGDAVTLADVCLVPQMFNARRFAVDLAPFPTLSAIDARLQTLAAVAAAHPDAPEAEARD